MKAPLMCLMHISSVFLLLLWVHGAFDFRLHFPISFPIDSSCSIYKKMLHINSSYYTSNELIVIKEAFICCVHYMVMTSRVTPQSHFLNIWRKFRKIVCLTSFVMHLTSGYEISNELAFNKLLFDVPFMWLCVIRDVTKLFPEIYNMFP